MGNCCGCSGNNEIQPVSEISVISTPKMGENHSGNTSAKSDSFIRTSRSCTNLLFLIIMIAFYLLLIMLLIYCLTKGDINRSIKGFDNCGNICGQKNEKDPAFPCKGEDMRNKKLILIHDRKALLFYITINAGKYRRECVSNCNEQPGFVKIFNRCIVEDFFLLKENVTKSTYEVRQYHLVQCQRKLGLNYDCRCKCKQISKNIAMCSTEVMYLTLIAIVFSFVLLVLYRYFINYFVTFVFFTIISLAIGVSVFLWIKWNIERKGAEQSNYETVYLWSAIAVTVVTVIIILIVFILRKRIYLVMQLFKEAGKAIAHMPLLIFFPIISFFLCGGIFVAWLFALILITSSGDLAIDAKTKYYYFKHNNIIEYTLWHSLLGLLWLLFFVKGCQDMCIAGSVGQWFFARNKSKLNSPIQKSVGNVFKYHLGTVAVGSFMIAVLQFIRLIIRLFLRLVVKPAGDNVVVRAIIYCIECCLAIIQKIVQYLSKNAYIETAINGLPFCSAGRRAFKLLVENASTVAVICSVGSFILFLGKLIIVLSTVTVGYFWIRGKEDITSPIWPLALVGIISFIIANIFIGVYEMIIDTLFICFCEDVDKNDGEDNPYYMSKDLMTFVENSKKYKHGKSSAS